MDKRAGYRHSWCKTTMWNQLNINTVIYDLLQNNWPGIEGKRRGGVWMKQMAEDCECWNQMRVWVCICHLLYSFVIKPWIEESDKSALTSYFYSYLWPWTLCSHAGFVWSPLSIATSGRGLSALMQGCVQPLALLCPPSFPSLLVFWNCNVVPTNRKLRCMFFF